MVLSVFMFLWDYYHYALEKADARARDYPLVSGFEKVGTILLLYFLAVSLGPRVMKHRAPFKLNTLLVVYNFVLVILSAYVTVEVFVITYLMNYSIICQPIDFSDNPLAVRCSHIGWWFYILKLIELADTIFFVLRKKSEQVTFLHVYHHSIMVIIGWLSVNYTPGGSAFLYPLVNSAVHVVMYTYYAMAAMGPSVQKYLWWKRYLTLLQLVQFVIMLVHTVTNLIVDCGFPKLFPQYVLVVTGSILILFLNFYHKAYITRKGARKDKYELNGQAKTDNSELNGMTKNHYSDLNGVIKDKRNGEVVNYKLEQNGVTSGVKKHL